jgi:hypothetical protein
MLNGLSRKRKDSEMDKAVSLSLTSAVLFGAMITLIKSGTPADYGLFLAACIMITCFVSVIGMIAGFIMAGLAVMRKL